MDNTNTPHNTTGHHHHISSSSSSSNPSSDHQNQFWLMNASQHQHHHHHHQQQQQQAHCFNLNVHENDNGDEENDNNNEAGEEAEAEKEAMFEKPLTPSDVGKLNRLVIPKQHAERYFPLGGDAAAEKGLLLCFEDDSGKPWRFRYSYWNSSQSYVLTKGWSRYVKENRLDAGDVVLFRRLRSHSQSDRLFIGWRRRDASSASAPRPSYDASPRPYPAHHHHTAHYHNNNNSNSSSHIASSATLVVPYQPDSIHAGLLSPHHQNQTTTIGNNTSPSITTTNNNNNSSSKILRLFGVNLEYHDHQDQSEPSTPDGSSLSSQDHHQPHHNFYPQAFYSNHLHNHMDFTFSRDVKPMSNRRG